MTNKLPPHPTQPLVVDKQGTVRFRENKIVSFLLDNGSWDLNKLCVMEWPEGDYTHLMQLIGYSVSGYGELSTSPPDLVEVADALAAGMIEVAEKGDTAWDEIALTVVAQRQAKEALAQKLSAEISETVTRFLQEHDLLPVPKED